MALEFKFLQSAFGQVRQRNSSATEHAIAGTVASTSGLIGSVFDPSRAGWDFDQAINNALERVIWVFRCVDAIATNFAGLRMVGRKGDPYEGEIYKLDQEIDRLLNQRSNEYETSEEFRYRLMAQLLLSKRGAFIEMERNRFGDISKLHLLPPHLTEPVPDPDEFVKEYRVSRVEDGSFDVVAKENVIWVKIRPHPSDPYLQMNPLMAAQLAVETDWLARLYNRNFLMRDGRPALLIAIANELGRDSGKEIKQRLNGGVANAGETIVIEADGLSTVDLGQTPHEAQWLEAITGSKQDILLAFGTPESVLGNASGRTFDNADAEREGWWMDTVRPASNRVARGMDILTGDLNDGNFISIDYSNVDVLQRAIKAKHDKAAADFAAGLSTFDEYLEAVGKKPLGVPASRVYWHPNGMIVAKDEEDAKIAGELPNVQAIIGGGTGQQPADPAASAQQGALQGAQEGARQFNNEFAARIQRLMAAKSSKSKKPSQVIEVKSDRYLEDDDNLIEGYVVPEGKAAPYADSRDQLEGEFGKIIGEWDSKQVEIIVGRLGFANILACTRHWSGPQPDFYDPVRGLKALDPQKVVQVARWKRDLKNELMAAAVPAVRRELRRVTQEMHTSGITKVMAKRGLGGPQTGGSVSRVYGSTQDADKAVQAVLTPLEAIVDAAAERQSQRVIKKIKDLDAAGKSISEIKAEVQRMIGDRAGWKQGLSEFLSGSAIEGIRADAYSKAGPIMNKVWVTVGDEHTRATHRKVDQVIRPNNGKFKVGKYMMAHPGDPKAGPEETANCFPADTLVDTGGIQRVYRRWYEGPLVEVVVGEGQKLSGTPNHPVLTNRGWIALGQLKKGDKVIRHKRDVESSVGHDVHGGPTPIGEVFDALAMSRDVVRVSGGGVNFHGERPDGDVDVVGLDGSLGLDKETTADKFVSQLMLPSTDSGTRTLMADGSLLHFRDGAFNTTDSVVSGLGESDAFLKTGSGHTHGQSFGSSAWDDALAQKEGAERIPAYSMRACEDLFGLAGYVTLDDVVSVARVEDWSGHVYNLETSTGAYVANSIAVHNCRCWLEYEVSDKYADLYDEVAS